MPIRRRNAPAQTDPDQNHGASLIVDDDDAPAVLPAAPPVPAKRRTSRTGRYTALKSFRIGERFFHPPDEMVINEADLAKRLADEGTIAPL